MKSRMRLLTRARYLVVEMISNFELRLLRTRISNYNFDYIAVLSYRLSSECANFFF